MAMCVKVARTFGGEDVPEVDDLDISAQWQDANVRNEKVQAETAAMHKALGVPDTENWATLGFSPDKIAMFKDEARTERAKEIASITESLRANQVRNAPQTQPQSFNGNGNTNQ